jgi:hypothetical protein
MMEGGKRFGARQTAFFAAEPIDKRRGPSGAENRIKEKGRSNPGFFCIGGFDMGIEAIAQWFLIKESMTLGKLQVLCYCAYAWTLVFLNKRKTLKYRLFEESFQGWGVIETH